MKTTEFTTKKPKVVEAAPVVEHPVIVQADLEFPDISKAIAEAQIGGAANLNPEDQKRLQQFQAELQKVEQFAPAAAKFVKEQHYGIHEIEMELRQLHSTYEELQLGLDGTDVTDKISEAIEQLNAALSSIYGIDEEVKGYIRRIQYNIEDLEFNGSDDMNEAALDPSGLQAAASMVKDYIITAEVDGKTKKFRIRGMTGERSAKERFLKHHSMAKVISVKPEGVTESAKKSMSRAAKGNEKYGKDGMKALAKAGRDGASEEKMDSIRDKYDHYNESTEKTSYKVHCSQCGNEFTRDKKEGYSHCKDHSPKKKTVKENASAGATGASSVAVSMAEGSGQGGFSKQDVIRRLGEYGSTPRGAGPVQFKAKK